MAIGMIEFQGTIQRTQDYTTIKQQEDSKPAVDQSNLQVQTDRRVDEKLRQVSRGDDTAKNENHADAKEKGKGSYAGDGGAKRKKSVSQEGRVVLKGISHFDMSV